ncbi:MAG: SPOR domain-containing protein [Rhodocyclaceae bacterium]|nr:SPOR domain-containing protein [Rhodocyclaceae bacterium]
MRLALMVLVLANLVLFAWGQGYLGEVDAGREPGRLQQQIEPGKLRILPAGAASAAPAVALLCQRIEGLSAAEADTFKRRDMAETPGWTVTLLPDSEAGGHWVLIAQLSSRAVAERKRTELRQLGVKEGQIIEDAEQGPFAVSLGVFRSQALAEEFLQSLTRKGVRSAQLARRDIAPEKFIVELRAPADELERKLPELMAPLAGASRTDCPAQ